MKVRLASIYSFQWVIVMPLPLKNDLNSFSPVNTSNLIFIPELLKGQKVTRNISLAVDKDADSKIYNLIVKMSYEDAAGKQYESSGIVSVLIKGNNDQFLLRW